MNEAAIGKGGKPLSGGRKRDGKVLFWVIGCGGEEEDAIFHFPINCVAKKIFLQVFLGKMLWCFCCCPQHTRSHEDIYFLSPV